MEAVLSLFNPEPSADYASSRVLMVEAMKLNDLGFPTAAAMTLRAATEALLFELFEDYQVPEGNSKLSRKILGRIRTLKDAGIIDQCEAHILRQIVEAGNAAAHGRKIHADVDNLILLFADVRERGAA